MDWTVFATVAAGVLLAPVVAVAFIAWTSLKPPRTHGAFPAHLPRESARRVTFSSVHSTLAGWRVVPESRPRGVVVLAHGWGSQSEHMLKWSAFLREAGWASLALDLSGHGNSEGAEVASLPVLADDIAAAGAFLDEDPALASVPRVYLGHSMGGASTLLALSRGLPAHGAVISSAPARVETLTDYVLKRWLIPPTLFRWVVRAVWRLRLGDLRALEPEATIRRVRVPLLLTHGSADPVVSLEEMNRLAASAEPMLLSLAEIGNAAHSDVVDYPAYQRAVTSFLGRSAALGAAEDRA